MKAIRYFLWLLLVCLLGCQAYAEDPAASMAQLYDNLRTPTLYYLTNQTFSGIQAFTPGKIPYAKFSIQIAYQGNSAFQNAAFNQELQIVVTPPKDCTGGPCTGDTFDVTQEANAFDSTPSPSPPSSGILSVTYVGSSSKDKHTFHMTILYAIGQTDRTLTASEFDSNNKLVRTFKGVISASIQVAPPTVGNIPAQIKTY